MRFEGAALSGPWDTLNQIYRKGVCALPLPEATRKCLPDNLLQGF